MTGEEFDPLEFPAEELAAWRQRVGLTPRTIEVHHDGAEPFEVAPGATFTVTLDALTGRHVIDVPLQDQV